MKIVCRMNQRRVRNFKKKWDDYYGMHCAYCTVECESDGTIDHIIPRCLGGKNEQSNLVIACRACNELKADKLVEEFRPLMLQPLALDMVTA